MIPLLLALAAGPLGQPGPLEPILYEDCGSPGRQPHVRVGKPWTFSEDDVSAPLPARTVAFDATAVRVTYEGLAPEARYGLRVVYATERDNPRTQRLLAEGVELHGALPLPEGQARTYEYDVPPGVVADGALDLTFERISGPNAVLSEVWLLSDIPHPRLHVSLRSDLRGTLTVSAFDGLLQPRPGAEVVVAGPGDVRLTAMTDQTGEAQFGIPDDLSLQAHGELSVRVQADDLRQERTVPVDAVIFRRPVLTPIPADVPGLPKPTMALGGTWRFSPAPPDDFHQPEFDDAAWAAIEVPGEWAMQGFSVEPAKAAGYRRVFRVPRIWRGHGVKIRFDAVFSQCRVWLNGVSVGAHQVGFTPFEVDVTEAVLAGKRNVLALAVTSEGLADTLASASQYARHPLGGITRKVALFAVPQTNLSRFHADTDLDEQYVNATLTVRAEVSGPTEGARLRVRLNDPLGRPVRLPRDHGRVRSDGTVRIGTEIESPALWDAEHPNLYDLVGELLVEGAVVERVCRRIGFRKVEVAGPALLVNGRPVKLRGVCRHEVDPDRGRSLTPAMWRRDVELLKSANVNLVRTAHYPPAEEFIDLCDEAGIYVQDEAPFCWVREDSANSPEALGLLLRSTAEMIERDRSHPSVIIWDLANESAWGDNFRRTYEYAREEDPLRPALFSGHADADPAHGRPAGTCEIESWHYPGPGGPDRTADSHRPVTFDEYCHLNCYNPEEVTEDPGLRDYWGRPLQSMWDAMYDAPACLGGAIWCWADDVFDVPGVGRVGYGEWGIVDGWRRPKPEWWHLKKAYSPVRIAARSISPPEPGQALEIAVENRFDFTDLDEIACRWHVGRRRGSVRLAIPPRSRGTLTIPVSCRVGDLVHLRFTDAAGRVVDEYALPVGEVDGARAEPGGPAPTVRELDTQHLIDAGWFSVRIDATTGTATVFVGGDAVLEGGPWVSLAALGKGTEALADGQHVPAQEITVRPDGQHVGVRVRKSLGSSVVVYDLRIYGDGTLATDYRLEYGGEEVSVREIGLKWLLSGACEELAWRRRGLWTTYPDDHIGRLAGSALALHTPPPNVRHPTFWSHDHDLRGTNDFRSSKYGIMEASLTSRAGFGVQVVSDGTQHLRATEAAEGIWLRVNDFANGGGERFLRSHYAGEYRTVKAGEVLEGSVRLRLLRPS